RPRVELRGPVRSSTGGGAWAARDGARPRGPASGFGQVALPHRGDDAARPLRTAGAGAAYRRGVEGSARAGCGSSGGVAATRGDLTVKTPRPRVGLPVLLVVRDRSGIVGDWSLIFRAMAFGRPGASLVTRAPWSVGPTFPRLVELRAAVRPVR